jgi:hypothetical protein
MAGWGNLTDKAKLIVTIVSLSVTLIGAASTGMAYFVSIKDVINDYPKLQERVLQLEKEDIRSSLSKVDTVGSPFVTKEMYRKSETKHIYDINNLYWYKFPYERYAKKGIDY